MAWYRKNDRFRAEAVAAAAAVFAAHDSFIRAVIHFLARNRLPEEDVYQELFLALVRSPVPGDVRSIRSYLYRAIRNTIVGFLRRQARQEENFEKYAEKTTIPINNCPPTDAIVFSDERASAFRYLTRQLPHREAEAVTLRYRYECSIADIASKMGVGKRTVSRYLSAGLKRLRRGLAIE